MMISEELFDLREALLQEAFQEAGACEELVERWNKIDRAFKKVLIKKSKNECEQRYADEPILDYPDPRKKVA